MAKKMHDILPPKVAHKVEEAIKSFEVSGKKGSRKKKVTKNQKSSFSFKKGLLVGACLLLLFVGWYGYVNLPKADIEIWPNMDNLTLDQKVTIDTSATVTDTTKNIIPAQYVEVIQDSTQEFPATGMASNNGKSTGKIKVYNKLDSAFTLIKGTHFLSDSGKYFITLDKIIVPAATTKSGKLTAGSIDVTVQATDIGTDYNIGSSKFSIPKLNGTSYYYSIYAESTQAFNGGYTGNVKKVTNDDIMQAKDILTKKTLQDGKNALQKKVLSDEVLLDGATESSVVDAKCDVAPDAIKDAFTETVKVKVSALVFKKQDLENLIKNKALNQLPANKDLLGSSLTINYTPSSIDLKKGTMALSVQSSAKSYQSIDPTGFIDLLSNKTADQIQSTMDQIYDGNIAKTQVNFWPFWVKTAPSNKNRITIHINFQ